MSKKYATVAVLGFLALTFVAYAFKSPIFRYILQKKVQSIEAKSPNISVQIKDASVTGIRTFNVSGLNIGYKGKTINLYISQIHIKIPLLQLLKLNLIPNEVNIDSLLVTIKKEKKLNKATEYAFSIDTLPNLHLDKYIKAFNRLTIRQGYRLFNVLSSTDISINSSAIAYQSSADTVKLACNGFDLKNGQCKTMFTTISSGGEDQLFVNLKVVDKLKRFDAIISNGGTKVSIPIFESAIGLGLQFDSMHLTVFGKNIWLDSLAIQVESKSYGMVSTHSKLSDYPVEFDSIKSSISALIATNSFSVDSPSFVTINSLKLPFTLDVESTGKPKFNFRLSTGIFDASAIFSSLPKGLFPTLQGIKIQGNTTFEVITSVDFALPDSLKFFAKLTPINFRLLSYGRENFSRINGKFSYSIYVNDSTYKRIDIDTIPKHHPSLADISPHLYNAVVVSEDGGFFYHRGFDSNGFSYALARNIKEGRLARGGSTITMQLVKNLFLNRNKTITRKAEEALIVWLIETQRLVSKERLLEIYLNIIDWGPNVHGITEASEFYFDKKPAGLTLNESLFLANIIPRPHQFLYCFDDNGNLRDYMLTYFNFISETLYKRGLITTAELENLEHTVNLKGEAKRMLEERITIKASKVLTQ